MTEADALADAASALIDVIKAWIDDRSRPDLLGAFVEERMNLAEAVHAYRGAKVA